MPPLRILLAALVLAAPAAQAQSAAPNATGLATGLARDPAQVLAGTPTVGAITMMPGETYYGPGPITVGYLGAKKQLVLPTGAWVFVAVADRPSGHTPAVPLVSMVFAQFREARLVSLMSYLFNGRLAPSASRWTDAQGCRDTGAPRGGSKLQDQDGSSHACGWTVRQASWPKVSDPAWEQAPAVIERLGVAMPATGPLQFTRAWAVDGGSNYLAIRRVDVLGDAGDGGDAAQAAQSMRTAWLKDYLPLMLEGLDKKIRATELDPNQPARPRIRLSLID